MNNIVNFLSNTLIHQSLQDVCCTSLMLIENASRSQVAAAAQYNKHQINTLLVQLLAINFIAKNQNQIKNDLNIYQTDQTTQSNAETSVAVEDYCERKLLALSPIHGFSRKNYFVECCISDDIRMEVLSYLRPIDMFKTISLVSKQFHNNVKVMHQSQNYATTFCDKNYVFESFEDIEDMWDNYESDVDVRRGNGLWVGGKLDNINSGDEVAYVKVQTVYQDEQEIIRCSVDNSTIAPFGAMKYRPANTHRFVSLLKNGYLGETCDVNLKNCHTISGDEFKIIPFHSKNTWRCGWINFLPTWEMSLHRNKEIWATADSNLPPDHSFRIFQMRVTVDITQEYNDHNDEDQLIIRTDEYLHFRKAINGECLISLVFHPDDIDNVTYFGHKTDLEEQLRAKKRVFNEHMTGKYGGSLNPRSSKGKLITAVGYPNYCVSTPHGVFSAVSKDKEELNQFQNGYDKGEIILENDCMNMQISQKGVDKVYYDKTKDELLVKTVSRYGWVLDDPDPPSPLKKRYYVPNSNPRKLSEAKIVDEKLIDTIKNENIQDASKKEARYFELLREWKGFIKISIDITKEFDEFQERLKHDFKTENECLEWDNRKYFMTDVNYDEKQDKITQNAHVLLDSRHIYQYDAKFNMFDMETRALRRILTKVSMFVSADVNININMKLVCLDWYHVLNHL